MGKKPIYHGFVNNPGDLFDELIQTKLILPRRIPDIVSRLRLVEKIEEGITRQLTVISAPAGFGKTTLLGEWASRGTRDIAWYSIGEGDNEVRRFLSYLAAALNNAGAEIREGVIDALKFPDLPTVERLSAAILNDVEKCGDIVLVLDDYHWIRNEEIHDCVAFLIDIKPSNLHIILSSRTFPPFSLARLRGHRQISEIVASDLCFLEPEAVEFFGQLPGSILTLDVVSEITRRTEGWAAGLQMAALAPGTESNLNNFVRTFSDTDRFVSSYLIDEVLLRQSEEMKLFLLQTSLFDRFCAPLCDNVRARDDSSLLIDLAERANLFIIPIDENRQWFRYHHLFGEVLRKYITESDHGLVEQIHLAASDWFREHGFAIESVEHALAVGDIHRQIVLVNENIERIWSRGRQAMLLRWLSDLDHSVIRQWPILCVYHALALILVGNVELANQRLSDAQDATESESERSFDGLIYAVRAWICGYQGNAEDLKEWAEKARLCLPAELLGWRCGLSINLGDAETLEGNMIEADRHFSEAASLAEKAGDFYYHLLASSKWSYVLWCLGRLRQSMELCERLLGLAEKSGLSGANVVGYLSAHYSAALTDVGQLDKALLYAERAVAACDRRHIALLGWRYVFLIKCLLSLRQYDRAKSILNDYSESAVGVALPYWLESRLVPLRGRLLLSQGHANDAADMLSKYRPDEDGRIPYADLEGSLVFVRAAMAMKNPQMALELLGGLAPAVIASCNEVNKLELMLLQAQAHWALGSRDMALTCLFSALKSGSQLGFIQLFIDEGSAIGPLLERAKKTTEYKEFINQMQSSHVDSVDSTHGAMERRSNSGLSEPLSGRELDVMALIAEGCSNGDVAQRLFISVATVKWHTGNIYSKLGVSSRTQAVARAKVLGILS
jgi:LuxR family transcriptional regulator, maltose regulon positive regulatory protein